MKKSLFLIAVLNVYVSTASTVLEVTDYSTLQALDPTIAGNSTVIVRQRSVEADGAGGTFKWISGDTTPADNGTVLDTTITPSPPSGRWRRIYSGPLDIRWFGASPDDGTDDTSAFQSIASSANANITILVPSGTFICNGVTFTNTFVSIRGLAGAIISRTQADRVFQFNASNGGVRIENLTIDGANYGASGISAAWLAEFSVDNLAVRNCGTPGYAANHRQNYDGLLLAQVTRVLINNSRFSSCERDGVFCWPAKQLTVTSSVAENCGRSGFVDDILVLITTVTNRYSASEVTYIGNTITNCGAVGLYVEATTNGPCTVDITENKVLNCGGDDWEYGYGIVAGNHTRGRIVGNTLINYGVGGTAADFGSAIVVGDYDGDIVIGKNTVVSPRRVGIVANNTFSSAYALTIAENCVRGAGEQGIFVFLAPRTIISDNHVWNCQKEAVIVNSSTGTALNGNKLKDCALDSNGSYSGVSLLFSLSCTFSGGEINGTSHQYGINLSSSSIRELTGVLINQFTTGWITDYAGTTGGRIVNARRIFYGTAAPAVGSWSVGEIIENTAPAAAGNIGWVCTTAGSPGTWKSYGSISP